MITPLTTVNMKVHISYILHKLKTYFIKCIVRIVKFKWDQVTL